MIKALAHVCLRAADLDRSLAFYCDALGLHRHFNFFKDGQLFGFYLRIAPGQFVEIFKSEATAPAPVNRYHHFCFQVDDLDGLIAALKLRGIEVSPKKLGCDNSWQCWCQDPDGHDIEFQQYTGRSSQFTRGDCIVNW
ncbi:MAG TPA: VOC family protein [Verrucomicrobiae bacterium]|nr:VOC family protein [Verrucomicrobiae bacterium]